MSASSATSPVRLFRLLQAAPRWLCLWQYLDIVMGMALLSLIPSPMSAWPRFSNPGSTVKSQWPLFYLPALILEAVPGFLYFLCRITRTPLPFPRDDPPPPAFSFAPIAPIAPYRLPFRCTSCSPHPIPWMTNRVFWPFASGSYPSFSCSFHL